MNTKFFHSYAFARRNSKSIWALQDQGGNMIEEEAQLKQMGSRHFVELFKDDGSTNIEDQLKVIQLFHTFVQEEERDCFSFVITLAEIERVLKGFKKDKSPSLDGWPMEFFLNFFELLCSNILEAVE